MDRRKIELKAISEWISPHEKVMDLGCGRGILLEELVRTKDIYAVGVDSDFDKISRCIRRGINAYHGDIMDMLKTFDNNAFDWIICSRTLPELENAKEVIMESLRVGKRVAVGFINCAYWANRASIFFTGDRIINKVYPEGWQESRPLNPISVKSFREFCAENSIVIRREHFLGGNWEKKCRFMPNIFSGYAIFEILKEK